MLHFRDSSHPDLLYRVSDENGTSFYVMASSAIEVKLLLLGQNMSSCNVELIDSVLLTELE